MAVDKFPHTERGIRRTSYPLVPRRGHRAAEKRNLVEIFKFQPLYRHVIFDAEGGRLRNKRIEGAVMVSVVIYMERGNTGD